MRFLTVVILIIFLNNPGHSVLFSSPIPSPWFIEHFALEPVDLPANVSIALVTYDRNILPNEYIVFKNNSSTPLYMAGSPTEGYSEFDSISVEFPPGIGPLYKVVNGQAYKWDIKYNHPGTGYYFAWFKENQRKDSIWLCVRENRVWSELGTILELDPRNQYDGDRPKDIKIPEPQKVALPMVYGAKEIQIPLTVFYTLNNDYRSSSSYYFPDSVGLEIIFCFILVCFLVFIAIVLFVFKSIRGWLGENTQKEKKA